MKVVQLHEQTTKVFIPYPDSKNSPLWPHKVKKKKPTQKLSQNQKVRIEGTIENKSCSTT